MMNIRHIITLSILAIFGMIGLVYIGNKKLSLSGYTVLSLTKATFTSSNPYFDGPVWILTVAQGGVGQYAYGYFSKEDIGDMSGKQPEHDLEIEITYSTFAWEYPIDTDAGYTPIYKYEVKKWTCLFPPSEDDAIKNCGSNAVYYGKFPFSFTCFCVKRTKIADVAPIDNCKFHTRSTIKVSAKGQSYEETFDSYGKISGFVGPYVYVIWNGNLVKQNCPDLSNNYIAFYWNGWKVGLYSLYNDYLSKYNYATARLDSGELIDENTLNNLVNSVDEAASKFLNNEVHNYDEINTSGNKPFIVIEADDAQVPVYTFYVKATWLGIYQPSPKPHILYARGTDFSSGDYGYIYAEIENDGESGNINVWAECEPPVVVVDNTKTITLDKGERTSVTIKVTANVNEDVTRKCTIHAASVSSEDTYTVEVTAHRLYVCTDGDTMCKDNSVYVCVDGSWELYQVCDDYCGFRFGRAECISTPQDPIDGTIDTIGRSVNNIKLSLGDVILLVGIILAIVAFLVGPIKRRR